MRRPTLRRLAITGMAAAALAGAFALGPGTAAFAGTTHPATAHAKVTVVHLDGKTYSLVLGPKLGIKPIHPVARKQGPLTLKSSAKGAVSPSPKVYLVFWGAQWSNDPAGAEPALQAFFKGLFGSRDSWGKILNQYCEGIAAGSTSCGGSGTHIHHPGKSPLGGVFMDNSSNEPTNATAAQLAAEAVKAAQHFGSTASQDMNRQYVIASPSGTHPDGFPNSGFCGYHSDASGSGVGTVAWTNLPYIPDLGAGACTTLSNASLLDGWFSTETHEYAETDTDFHVGQGWIAPDGSEIGDLCVNLDATESLSTGSFDVQGLWSNNANGCVTSGP